MKIASNLIAKIPRKLGPEQLFMVTILLVNGGNYLYNLLLGRMLGPVAFSDAAILITLLLILSFVGMTFQIVTAKYAVLFEGNSLLAFIKLITKYATVLGILFGISIVIFYQELQVVFHTKTASMFYIFGIGIPLYFMMSVNRGLYQGQNVLNKLATTYQTEMASRLLLTIAALLLFPDVPSSIIVALGILFSFVFGIFPFQKTIFKGLKAVNVAEIDTRSITTFFALTAFYELTQIIINNSDIILVKHFFDSKDAGLYASLALIGRVVYFVAWMFVMLLLPKVIQMKKDNQDTLPILLKYVGYIAVLSSLIVGFTALFPEFVVSVMFGKEYVSISFLLWKYALATSLFAVANIFAYYYLSLNQYFPVVVSAVLGSTQIGLIIAYHNSLEQVVHMQIIAMVILLFFQLCYFFYKNKK
ncbi:Membrane protein involved in the export of O-antigen and teichoic acid [Flavobacterium gillisiae]|uniref:Membrane protein involved in the export of O-antigen and teichoic acid n=1 Tax=Flavobacterium gillisiae TaxID=150146 RepID=A0A1H4CT35_9FLAO|nr:sugar isomerase [Flavobacterium gillisiae]SEA63603.1 Membrane protein involved in the export of O-antigen and teichoic acid [Flavobacterium gillisiae]